MSRNKETLRLEHLSIGYAVHGGRDRVVAGDICASLMSGEMTVLIGPNGMGKSTLLRTLCAFQPRLGGRIVVQGRELDTYTEKELAQLIGIVLTSKPDIQNMTVTELVGLGRAPYTGFWGRLSAQDRQIVRESLSLVGIEPLGGRLIQTLSDGERQKVMIAKALAQQTPIIFLDEPTAFLDYPSKVETLQLLYRLSRETDRTVFLSNHDLDLALQMADRIWLMESGRLSIGTPASLAADGSLARFVERDGISFRADDLRILVRH
ncbi:MAG: ABC transporter ATP-binding protein [Bacteroidales bacterium]|nr:ABC transporter ATP-binding protein [Bacteroidales bacterium]